MQTGRHEHQRQQSQLVFLDPLQHLWCKVGDQDVHTCVTDTQNTMHTEEQHRHECMMAAWCTDLKTWSPAVPYKLSSLSVCKVFKSFIISTYVFGFDWLVKSYLRMVGVGGAERGPCVFFSLNGRTDLEYFKFHTHTNAHTYTCTHMHSYMRIFFSRVNFLCWLLFQYLFHPCVTAVARKRPRSFCQKRRWQVTAKHAHTLHMWLCMKWHGAWLYGVHRTRRDWLSLAAGSCGTSHASAVSTPLQWIFKKRAIKTIHSCRITCERSESARERRIALYKSD